MTALAAACSSSTTSLVGPTGDKCQISVSSSPDVFSAGGGTGSVTVSAARECTWSIVTNAGWVTITGDRSGQGDARVSYAVAANPAPAPRSGSISVGSHTVAINQSAAPCRYSLSRSQDGVAADGGRLSVDVSTVAGCSWTASPNASWIAISTGQSGNGSGTVGLAISANAGAQRVGQVNIGDQTYAVTQAAAAPPPAPPSPAPSPTPNPNPNPTPTPTPPPSGGDTIEFTGIVLFATGKCPDLRLNVGGRTVVTDNSTSFKGISCGDVSKPGRIVTVAGVTDSVNVVHATQITKAKNDDIVATQSER